MWTPEEKEPPEGIPDEKRSNIVFPSIGFWKLTVIMSGCVKRTMRSRTMVNPKKTRSLATVLRSPKRRPKGNDLLHLHQRLKAQKPKAKPTTNVLKWTKRKKMILLQIWRIPFPKIPSPK